MIGAHGPGKERKNVVSAQEDKTSLKIKDMANPSGSKERMDREKEEETWY